MGNLLSNTDVSIRLEFFEFRQWTPMHVFAHFAHFQSICKHRIYSKKPTSFVNYGYCVDRTWFQELFCKARSPEQSNKLWELWGGSRGFYEGEVNLLAVYAGLLMLCKGSYAEKIDALFDLFDFDERGVISKATLLNLLRSAVTGFAGMCYHGHIKNPVDVSIPSEQKLLDIVSSAQNAVGFPSRKLTYTVDDFAMLCPGSEEITLLVCKFGTVDSKHTVRNRKSSIALLDLKGFSVSKYAVKLQQEALLEQQSTDSVSKAQKKQTALLLKQTKVSQRRAQRAHNRFYFSPRTTERDIKHLKTLFDSLDTNSSGYVALQYLKVPPVKMAHSYLIRDVCKVFQALPLGSSTPVQLSFNQMLECLYPNITASQKVLLARWVPPAISRDTVKAMQWEFDLLDVHFKGKLHFKRFLYHLGTDPQYEKLIDYFNLQHGKTVTTQSLRHLHTKMTFPQILQIVLQKTHPRQLKYLMQYTSPSRLLSTEQQKDLSRLFYMHNVDDQNCIQFDEFASGLVENGYFSVVEVEELRKSFRLPVKDGKMTLQIFNMFYRDIWETDVNFYTVEVIKMQIEHLKEVNPDSSHSSIGHKRQHHLNHNIRQKKAHIHHHS